jgi:hypothetical protein
MTADMAFFFRIFVIAVLVVGLINVAWWTRRSGEGPVTFGPLTMSKPAFIRAVLVWNGIGIPILLFVLFFLWQP